MSNLQSDIDYMKSLAEAGGRGPVKNGATLFWAGLLYGAASLGQYALIMGWLPRNQAVAMFLWFGASIAFGIIAFIFGRGRNRIKGPASDRAVNSVWSAVGIGIIMFIICTAIVANLTHTFEPISYLMAPAVLLMYGMGWWVSGQMSDTGWVKLVSVGCFLGAPALALLGNRPEQMLTYAVCLFLFAMVPGLVLMRAEKA